MNIAAARGFADDASGQKRYLNEHPDLKQRYEALHSIEWGVVEVRAEV